MKALDDGCQEGHQGLVGEMLREVQGATEALWRGVVAHGAHDAHDAMKAHTILSSAASGALIWGKRPE